MPCCGSSVCLRRVQLDFIRPSKPTENEFAAQSGARLALQSWQHDYNHHRPHGTLGNLTPSEFETKDQKTGTEALILWF